MIYEAELQKLEQLLADRAVLRERADDLLRRIANEAMPERERHNLGRNLEHAHAALRLADEGLVANIPVLITELRQYAHALAQRHIERQRYDDNATVAEAERLLQLVEIVEKLP